MRDHVRHNVQPRSSHQTRSFQKQEQGKPGHYVAAGRTRECMPEIGRTGQASSSSGGFIAVRTAAIPATTAPTSSINPKGPSIASGTMSIGEIA